MIAIAALAATSFAAPTWAATDARMPGHVEEADTNADGVLSDNEGIRYIAFMRSAIVPLRPKARSPRPNSWMPARPMSMRRVRPSRAHP